jgi:hypothetical protein
MGRSTISPGETGPSARRWEHTGTLTLPEATQRLAKLLRAHARQKLRKGNAEDRVWAEETLRICG